MRPLCFFVAAPSAVVLLIGLVVLAPNARISNRDHRAPRIAQQPTTIVQHVPLAVSDGARDKVSDSARNLHPRDVRVVAAIGDSMTAGFAAKGLVPLEFRGVSFAIGGDEGRLTLPNILRNQTGGREVVGSSVGYTDPLEYASNIFGPHPVRPLNPDHAHLDAAISNAQSDNGPDQVKWLATVMQGYEAEGVMSMSKDWKLVVVLLGANDLRQVCRNFTADPKQVAASFARNVNRTLVEIRRQLPRTFVALLAVPDIGAIAKFGHSTWTCTAVQKWLEGGHCPEGEPTSSIQQAMNTELVKLSQYWNAVLDDDFAVAFQPFSSSVDLPNASYLSSLDCFHPGERGHAEMAVALWNSVISPRKLKKQRLVVGDTVMAADESTTLRVD